MESDGGLGVHFQNHATLVLQGTTDVLGDHVQTGHIQANQTRGPDRLRSHTRMNQVGDVADAGSCPRMGDATQDHLHARGHQRVEGKPLFGQHLGRVVIGTNTLQRQPQIVPAARIEIGLFHQLRDRMRAIARKAHGLAPHSRNHLIADYGDAVLCALRESFEQNLVAILSGSDIGGEHLLARAQIQADAVAVVSVAWLHHHGKAQLAGRGPGVLGAADRPPQRHREPQLREQLLAKLLVERNPFGELAGSVSHRRADAPLLPAVAKLHQTLVVQSTNRDSPSPRCRHQGTGRPAQTHVLGQRPQTVHFIHNIQVLGCQRRQADAPSRVEASAPQFLLFVLNRNIQRARR